MDLKSGQPFWPISNGLIQSYPRLRGSLKRDVLIVGAGITRAILADEFIRRGIRVVVLDRRDVGGGSTADAILDTCVVATSRKLRSRGGE